MDIRKEFEKVHNPEKHEVYWSGYCYLAKFNNIGADVHAQVVSGMFKGWSTCSQQYESKIAELEADNKDLFSRMNEAANNGLTLQAKLKIAVNALKTYAEGERYMISPNVATEALAEINRKGE